MSIVKITQLRNKIPVTAKNPSISKREFLQNIRKKRGLLSRIAAVIRPHSSTCEDHFDRFAPRHISQRSKILDSQCVAALT